MTDLGEFVLEDTWSLELLKSKMAVSVSRLMVRDNRIQEPSSI
jgi:hypothetical protein